MGPSRIGFVFVFALLVALSAPRVGAAPAYTAPQNPPTFQTGGATQQLDLKTLFTAGSAVRIAVRIGTNTQNVDLLLYDTATPITVANFLSYVNSGAYAGSFIHRSVPGFIVQGGGYRWNSGANVESVPTSAAIQNEPGISNLRGTVAMAKLGGDPNSATSQWFVNLADNSANLDAQNGGFTVFGRVAGSGMTVMDAVAAVKRYNAGSPFDTIPLTAASFTRPYTVETSASVIPNLTFTATSGAPNVLTASLTGSILSLTPSAKYPGPVALSLAATDVDGGKTNATLNVTVSDATPPDIFGATPEMVFTVANGQASVPDYRNSSVTASDPSGVKDFTQSPVAGTVLSMGTYPLTFTATDNAGNTVTASTTLTIGDTDPPTINGVAPVVLTADVNGNATVPEWRNSVVTASDASGIKDFTQSPAPGSVESLGSYPVTFTATDNAGNTATATTTLTVVDTTPPKLDGVAPLVLSADQSGQATVPDWRNAVVMATDASGIKQFTQSPAAGASATLGTHPVTFTATDNAGNSTSAQTTFAVAFSAVAAPTVAAATAHTGAPAPTAGVAPPPGSTIQSFNVPALSDLRDLAARVTIASGASRLAAIYAENGAGVARLVALQGQVCGWPKAFDVVFKSFDDPVLAPGGAIAFAAKVVGPKFPAATGLWTDLFGPLQPVLRQGASIPGLDDLTLKSITSFDLSDDAITALVKLAPANDTALVRVTGLSSGVLLARTGAPFSGSNIQSITVLQPAPQSPGQRRWSEAAETIARFTLKDKRSIVVSLGSDGTPVSLVQAGLTDPKLGATLKKLGLPALGGPSAAVLATGFAKSGAVSTTGGVLFYAEDGSTFAEVTREGGSSGQPDGSRFAAFADPVVNDQGKMLFQASLSGAGVKPTNKNALWLTTPGNAPALVVRAGANATDANGDPLPGNPVWSAFSSYALPDGADSGPIFLAKIAGKGVKASANTGLWAIDAQSKVRLLLQTSESLTLPYGQKYISRLTLLNSLPTVYSARRSYNQSGSLALLATFTDHSQALLRIDLR